VDGRTKHETFRRVILRAIENGRFSASEPLPAETDLAREYGIARNTVRRAFSILEQQGMIRRIRGKGTFVCPPGEAGPVTGDRLAAFALLVPDVRRNFLPSLIHGFDECARTTHHQMIVCSSGNDTHVQGDTILQLIDQRVAGVAMVPATTDPTPAYQVRQLRVHRIPVVYCHRPVEGLPAPLVCWRGPRVGRLAGQALARLGHRRVGMLGVTRRPLVEQYERSLRIALEDAGGEVRSMYLYPPGRHHTPDNDLTGLATEALVRLLSAQDRPTALFCSDDDLAELASRLLHERGLGVPADISLIGFGGRLRDSDFRKRLASVTVDEEEMGRRAARLLDEMLRGQRPFDDEERVYVSMELSDAATLGTAP
jgi:DNA-binding LacI/PurR family transcriptional regulator